MDDNHRRCFFQVCGRVLANCIRKLADSILLPHDFVTYGEAMKNALVPQNYGDYIDDINRETRRTLYNNNEDYKEINFVEMTRDLKKSVDEFEREAVIWNQSLEDKGNQFDNYMWKNLVWENVILYAMHIYTK